MSKAIENLDAAFQRATAIRAKVGGFPYLAETLRLAGVTRNIWCLPRMSELVFDGAWTSSDHWRGVGLRHS
jgi:uncharacterized protein YbcV (DUF1398 family)